MFSIALLGIDKVRVFDLAVCWEVWGVDRSADGVPRCSIGFASAHGKQITTDVGVTVDSTISLAVAHDADLLIVPGAVDPRAGTTDDVRTMISKRVSLGRPVAALCSGALVLAESGALDGRRATTHWLHTDELRRDFPAVTVDHEALFVHDGPVWTSAGTTAGVDLSVELIRAFFGGRAASVVARRMVMAPHRSAHQSQFVEPIAENPSVGAHTGGISMAIEWASANLHAAVSVSDLARAARMSERSFNRQFRAAAGTSPMQWLIERRTAHARRLLEETTLPVDTVARQSGFGSAANLRARFSKRLDTTPARYREEFVAGSVSRVPAKADSAQPTANSDTA